MTKHKHNTTSTKSKAKPESSLVHSFDSYAIAYVCYDIHTNIADSSLYTLIYTTVQLTCRKSASVCHKKFARGIIFYTSTLFQICMFHNSYVGTLSKIIIIIMIVVHATN